MTVVAGSKAAAPGIKSAFEMKDRHCIIDIRGDVLTIYTARSMARRALLRPQFKEVSDKAFDWIHQTTGIDPARSDAMQEAA
jgi:hypothetical protein